MSSSPLSPPVPALVEVARLFDGLLYGAVEAAGVTADHAVDEAGWLVEIVRGRQQIRVLPHGVAGVDAAGLRQLLPQHRGLPQFSGPQLETDQRCEGLLGGAAGRPSSAQRLAQRRCAGDPLAKRIVDRGLHPALDERQQRLQPLQRSGLLGRGLRLENALVEQLLHLRGVRQRRRVEPGCELLDAGHVDLHALGERFHGVEQLTGQPRHVAEQSVVRGFPRGEECHDLAARLFEAFGE